jgi:hypothetical protein
VESNGRRWIVANAFVRDAATFFALAESVEMRGGDAVRYMNTSESQDDAMLCESSGSPQRVPAGWGELPKAVKDFLCIGAR